jgi:CBS-domain-containing membrane protein
MLKAKDIMTREVLTVTEGTNIREAARMLLDRHINGMPVVDEDGALIGIICQSDLVAQQKQLDLPSMFTILDTVIPFSPMSQFEREVKKISALTVGEAMTRDPYSVTPETGINDLANIMVDRGFHTLPVIEGGKLVGVIGKEDVLRTLFQGK